MWISPQVSGTMIALRENSGARLKMQIKPAILIIEFLISYPLMFYFWGISLLLYFSEYIGEGFTGFYFYWGFVIPGGLGLYGITSLLIILVSSSKKRPNKFQITSTIIGIFPAAFFLASTILSNLDHWVDPEVW